MVEFSKACRLPVCAANAPRRYVSAVGRSDETHAAAALREALREGAACWLPPLPLPPPSDDYLRHLRADPAVVHVSTTNQIGGALAEAATGSEAGADAPTGAGGDGKDHRCPYIGLRSRDGLLQPMLLWDATMAHSIARSLAAEPDRLVLHVCGSFHCEMRQGIASMLERYRPATRQLIVVAYPERDCHRFVPARHAGRGDFVVLTDDKVTSERCTLRDVFGGAK